jgi:hypothetical protein
MNANFDNNNDYNEITDVEKLKKLITGFFPFLQILMGDLKEG